MLQAGPEIYGRYILMRDMEDIYGHSTAGTVKYSVLSTPTPATDSNLKEIDFKTKIQI